MAGETGDPSRTISLKAPTVSAHCFAAAFFRGGDGQRLDPCSRWPPRARAVSEGVPFVYCHTNLCGTIVWPLLKPRPRCITSHCELCGATARFAPIAYG